MFVLLEKGRRSEKMGKIIEFDEKCKNCRGTGLYRGIGENMEDKKI